MPLIIVYLYEPSSLLFCKLLINMDIYIGIFYFIFKSV